MKATRRRVHLFVAGRVQGVGFRYATAQRARGMDLDGWARNTADGRVEIVAEGAAEQIDLFCEWCRQGPPGARVDSLSRRDELAAPERRGFEIRC